MVALLLCTLMLAMSNMIIWYPFWSWKKIACVHFRPARIVNNIEIPSASIGIIGLTAASVTLSVVIVVCYCTSLYETILKTHCGSTTENTVASISAIITEIPNSMIWRIGMTVLIPVITFIAILTHIMPPQPPCISRKLSFAVNLLEVSNLAVLTVRFLLYSLIVVYGCFHFIQSFILRSNIYFFSKLFGLFLYVKAVSSKESHIIHQTATILWMMLSLLLVCLTSYNNIYHDGLHEYSSQTAQSNGRMTGEKNLNVVVSLAFKWLMCMLGMAKLQLHNIFYCSFPSFRTFKEAMSRPEDIHVKMFKHMMWYVCLEIFF